MMRLWIKLNKDLIKTLSIQKIGSFLLYWLCQKRTVINMSLSTRQQAGQERSERLPEEKREEYISR
jgi:hypothetical protein